MDSILTNRLRARGIRAGMGAVCRAVLNAVFLLVCLRFLVAEVRSAGPDIGPALVLGAGALALGAWKPSAALFAFTLAVPLLSGVEVDNLVECASPLGLVFSALWMGMAVNGLIRHRGSPPTVRGRPDGDGDPPEPVASGSSLPLLASDVLIATVVLSLGWQLWRHRDFAGIWQALLDRPVFGFGDPLYFLTSAFLWLQGLFYFRSVYGLWAHRGADEGTAGKDAGSAAPWIAALFAAYGTTLAIFVLMQLVLHIPEGWTSAGLQAPYEDISSFGSIGVAVFIFAAATLSVAPPWRLAANVLACGGLLAMVILSWSRAAWLAGLVFLLLVALLRLSRRWAAALLIVPVAAVVLINVIPRGALWTGQPYLARLAALARVESPLSKDPVRLNLYRKAAAMIHQNPLGGHGIGSFYLESVNFAPPSDPHGSEPEFAHNVLLQVAAELGVPIAVLLAALTAWGLWRGVRTWLRGRSSGPGEQGRALLALGATLSLGAYLQTQMTANSLNVYVSNQFFFWFLLAALLAMGAQDTRRSG